MDRHYTRAFGEMARTRFAFVHEQTRRQFASPTAAQGFDQHRCLESHITETIPTFASATARHAAMADSLAAHIDSESGGGLKIMREVTLNYGRADIVIVGVAIIECKLILHPGAISKARGQLWLYARDLPGYRKIIAGMESSHLQNAEDYPSEIWGDVKIWLMKEASK